jgi:hypothetical protein
MTKIIDLNKALEAKQAHLYRLAQAQKARLHLQSLDRARLRIWR